MKSSTSSDSPADASTSNIPRPSSSFPSSFTPFYPRSQQYYGYSGSGSYYYGAPPAQADSNAPNRYNQDCRDFYGQSDSASLEEYEEHSSMPECSYPIDSWNLQWGNPPNYVDNSAFAASETSLRNSPPNLLPHNIVGNSTYVSHHEPTSLLHNDRVFIAATSAFASHTLPVRSSCLASKKINITKSESDIFESQAGSTGKPIDAPKISSAENLDRKSISFKSTQMLSAAVANDNQANQQFTEVKDGYSSPAHNGDINGSKNEDHLVDNIRIGGTVTIPANRENNCSSCERAGCSSFSAHSRASPTDIAATHSASKIKGQHEDASLISSHVNHSQMIQSTEGKVCQSCKGTSTTNVSDRCADAGSLHERKSCVYSAQDTDKSDGNKLLVESIYNLSLLLSKKKFSTAHESFDSKDLTMLKTIHMLCLSLTQDSVIEKGETLMERQINQGSTEIVVNNSMKDDMGSSIYSILECLNPLVNGPQGTSSFECSSCRKAEGTEVCKHISTVAEKYGVQDEKPSMENNLSQLKVEFLQLQDDIAYERAESSGTVSIYKNLCSEAHAKLEAFKLEMLKIKDDLNGMKDLLQKLNDAPNLNDTGHTKARPDCINSCLVDQNEYNFCNKSEDAAIRHNSENPEISGQGLTEHNHMLKETVAAIVSSKGDHKFLEKENIVDPQIAMHKRELKDSVKQSMNLESDVSQRLSMLLARQKMDAYTSCTDEERLSVDLNNLYGCSKYVLQGDQSEVSQARHEVGFKEVSSSSETSPMGDTNAKHLTVCDARLPAEYLMKCNAAQRGLSTVVGDELWECQEDEIEIICLRPSYADNKLVYAKGETEWEHVEIDQKGFLS